MRASSVSVVSLALVALTLWSAPTFAQQTTCSDSTLVCRKEGENCAQSVTPGTFVQCSAGTYCNSNNQCARQPTLGNSCTNTVGCFDESYPDAVSCINGVCMYTNLYFPGESCNSGSNYYNGGCAVGSCNNGKCTSIAQGGNCTGAETLCAPGLYCNDAAQCVARLAANSQCSGNEECEPTLVCTRRGATTGNPSCQSPFNQANDQGCDTFYDCAANLLCINQKCTQPATPTSGNCGNQAVTFCGAGNTCDCDSRINGQNLTTSSTGQCERVGGLSSSFINAAKDFQQCAKDKGCQDVWAIQNINDNDLTNGPSQCTSSCSGRNTLFGFSGAKYNSCFSGSSSAAVVMPAILAVLIALVAVLML